MDAATFRSALSRFASGVTILTIHVDGTDLGMTATAFSSVSVDPPMVLVCIARNASMAPALERVTHLGVHLLGADQAPLSRRFAATESERFSGLGLARGAGDIPLLPGALARLQCRIVERHAGGDHVILLAEVLEVDLEDGAPLIYFRGRYGTFDP